MVGTWNWSLPPGVKLLMVSECRLTEKLMAVVGSGFEGAVEASRSSDKQWQTTANGIGFGNPADALGSLVNGQRKEPDSGNETQSLVRFPACLVSSDLEPDLTFAWKSKAVLDDPFTFIQSLHRVNPFYCKSFMFSY